MVLGGVQTAAKTVANALSIGIQQTPGVAKAIWPAGTASTQTFQISELKLHLSKLDSSISDRLNAGLFAIMANTDEFIKFASSGAFSGGQDILNLPVQTSGLDIAFKTFLISSAMAQNQYVAFTGPPYSDDQKSKLPGVNGELYACKVESNGICDFADADAPRPNNNPAAPAGSGNNRPLVGGSRGQPKGWAMYTSKDTKRAYHPQPQRDIDSGPSAPSNVVAGTLADGKWDATPEMVFDLGYECMRKGGPKGQPLVSIGNDGKFDFSCLSQLEVKDGCVNDACAEFFGLGTASTAGAAAQPNPAAGTRPNGHP